MKALQVADASLEGPKLYGNEATVLADINCCMHGMVKEWDTYDRKYRHTHKHTILLRMCTQARHNYAMFVRRFHCILNKCVISSGMQQVIRQMMYVQTCAVMVTTIKTMNH